MRRQNTTFKTDECVTLAYECAKQISSDVWYAECENVRKIEQQSGDMDLIVENRIEDDKTGRLQVHIEGSPSEDME